MRGGKVVTVTIDLHRLQVPAGDRLLLARTTWAEFERIVAELGEGRSRRVAYYQGVLEIMTPLPEHEDAKEIFGDLIKVLLEEFGLEFRSLGSTTFKKATMEAGIEPDQCFYIRGEAAVRGKTDLNLAVDPPPDIALEIDITSRTHPEIYAALGVSELWRFDCKGLQIHVLRGDRYEVVAESPTFPGVPVAEQLPEFWRRSRREGRTPAIAGFRRWLQRFLARSRDA